MLVPTEVNVGLTGVSLGVVRAVERQGLKLSVFKPISQPIKGMHSDKTTSILRANSKVFVADSIKISHTETLITPDKKNVLMEEIVNRLEKTKKQADIVLVEGIVPTNDYPFANELNYDIAKALDAEIIFVMSLSYDSKMQFAERVEIVRSRFGGSRNSKIIGVIVNKINMPIGKQNFSYLDLTEINPLPTLKKKPITVGTLRSTSPIPVLGAIPWNIDLNVSRAIDVANYLSAKIVNKGDINNRRIGHILFGTGSIENTISHFREDVLLVISADRTDLLISASLAVMNGLKIGGILLTDGFGIDKPVYELCSQAFATELPVFMVEYSSWQTSINLFSFRSALSADDKIGVEKLQNFVADHIDMGWLKSLTKVASDNYCLSPSAFRHKLTELAIKADKVIVLPEGDEPRTIQAAVICARRRMAKCVLLGDPNKIKQVAAEQGVKLGKGIEIVDPDVARDNYVPRLIELRKSKGMTEIMAREQLADNVVLGTMMLEQNEVDGLVSGAVHTTANTIRPPLQIIKTAPGSLLVSSVFFMLMPEQVYIYGDCAINLDPTANELANIAIQSAETAIAFGIEPRVAMLSYSTGDSGQGADVEKVREAARIAKEKRPDLIIEGPLQYDASVMPDVAKSKAPNSLIAGNATVFIFPDLNSGNITYKAVQRSADVLSIGPILQGMRKPVNDLSRGALVDDIVYTIVLTAIQATQ